MDVFEAIKTMKAELVSNRAIARVGDDRVIVARVVGREMTLTEQGEAILATLTAAPKKTPAPKKTKKAQSKKRARNKDGTLKGDDPSTPDVNEAWVDGDS